MTLSVLDPPSLLADITRCPVFREGALRLQLVRIPVLISLLIPYVALRVGCVVRAITDSDFFAMR